jgi:hypothetical protein
MHRIFTGIFMLKNKVAATAAGGTVTPISEEHRAQFRRNNKLVFSTERPPRWMTPAALRNAVIAGETNDWSVLSYNFQTGEPYRIFPEFICLDCQSDTLRIDEYYMVQDAVWNHVVSDDRGMLCVGCLETRLGRILTQADFVDAPINSGWIFSQSPRLKARLDSLVCTLYPIMALTEAEASGNFSNRTSYVPRA